MTSKNKYYDIVENKADRVADVLIYGLIGESLFQESITARRFVSDFRKLEKEHDVINIRINSPGGSIFDGLAIFNAISGSTKDVHTYNDGLCASMAAVLLLAVDPNNIHPAKNSLLMLHSPMSGAYGNRKDIEKVIDVLDKVTSALIISICDKTGFNKEDVESKYFDYNDHWYTAAEAQTEGFYLNVEEEESENVPQNALNMKFLDLVKLFEPSNSIFPEWINRIAPSPEETTNNFIDMDIKKLRDVYNLTEEKYQTEEDVLNFVLSREAELLSSNAAKEQAETELTAKAAELATAQTELQTAQQASTANEQVIAERDQTIATLQGEIATLKAAPAEQAAAAFTEDDGDANAKPGPVSAKHKDLGAQLEAVSLEYLGKKL